MVRNYVWFMSRFIDFIRCTNIVFCIYDDSWDGRLFGIVRVREWVIEIATNAASNGRKTKRISIYMDVDDDDEKMKTNINLIETETKKRRQCFSSHWLTCVARMEICMLIKHTFLFTANIHIHHKLTTKQQQITTEKMRRTNGKRMLNFHANQRKNHNIQSSSALANIEKLYPESNMFFFCFPCVCVKRNSEWCTRYKWLLSCRYFSLAKRYNIIIMIVRICETNVSNDKLVEDFFTSPSLDVFVCASVIVVGINTKNILARKRSVFKKQVLCMEHAKR